MSEHRRVTQRDVAAAAGVSNAAVSYVLSGRRDRARPVSDATRRRVLDAVAHTGYRMNDVARSLRRRRTDVVLVVYPTPSSPAIEESLNLFTPAAARRGLTTACLPIVDGATDGAVRFLEGGLADAALLLRGHGLSPAQLHRLAGHLAIVAFDDTARPRGFDVVRTHYDRAQARVIDRLVAAGRRRIALFLHNPQELTESGYQAGLHRHRLGRHATVYCVASDRSAAHECALAILAGPDRPDAIAAASDRSAVQAIYAAHELGLRVPEDVAIIGCGDIDEGRATRPALSTIGPPTTELDAVMDRLFRRIDSPTRPTGRALELPWRLIARDSG